MRTLCVKMGIEFEDRCIPERDLEIRISSICWYIGFGNSVQEIMKNDFKAALILRTGG